MSILYLQVLVRRSLIYSTLYQEVVTDYSLVCVYFDTFDHHVLRYFTAFAGWCCGFICFPVLWLHLRLIGFCFRTVILPIQMIEQASSLMMEALPGVTTPMEVVQVAGPSSLGPPHGPVEVAMPTETKSTSVKSTSA